MKEIKVIFIALEIASLLGVITLVFLTDLTNRVENLTLVKVTIVMLAIYAVVCQREQGKIDREEKK